MLPARSVKAILDANRNSLMLLDLKISICTLGVGSGGFVAALYGMNLKNFIEENDLGFFGVSAWCFLFGCAAVAYGLNKLRKVQRVSMWGESGRRAARGSWRTLEDESTRSLLEAGRREKGERYRRLKEERASAIREGLEDHKSNAQVPMKIKS